MLSSLRNLLAKKYYAHRIGVVGCSCLKFLNFGRDAQIVCTIVFVIDVMMQPKTGLLNA
jgi:hypothetical protein